MIIYLNGRYVPEEQALVSIFDRGFLYGDGLFETLRVRKGRLFMWTKHRARLEQGAERLGIRLPDPAAIPGILQRLVEMNSAPECLLRITVSRGPGKRGYSARGADNPTLALSLHPLPENCDELQHWRVMVSPLRASDPLARHKTSNKLLQVLARTEAEAAGLDDAIMLHPDGAVAEASGSNVFWIKNGGVRTPAADGNILSGITRSVIMRLCGELGLPVLETSGTTADLLESDGVFLTQTTFGIVEVSCLDGATIARSDIVANLHRAYINLLRESA
jgi:branched-chain amino acid aminotransferase